MAMFNYHTGCAGIYSRGISHLIANMLSCLFDSNLSEIWPRRVGKKGSAIYYCIVIKSLLQHQSNN